MSKIFSFRKKPAVVFVGFIFGLMAFSSVSAQPKIKTQWISKEAQPSYCDRELNQILGAYFVPESLSSEMPVLGMKVGDLPRALTQRGRSPEFISQYQKYAESLRAFFKNTGTIIEALLDYIEVNKNDPKMLALYLMPSGFAEAQSASSSFVSYNSFPFNTKIFADDFVQDVGASNDLSFLAVDPRKSVGAVMAIKLDDQSPEDLHNGLVLGASYAFLTQQSSSWIRGSALGTYLKQNNFDAFLSRFVELEPGRKPFLDENFERFLRLSFYFVLRISLENFNHDRHQVDSTLNARQGELWHDILAEGDAMKPVIEILRLNESNVLESFLVCAKHILPALKIPHSSN